MAHAHYEAVLQVPPASHGVCIMRCATRRPVFNLTFQPYIVISIIICI